MKISVFITNLGKYNDGYLVGEWVDFPVSSDEIEEVFSRIGIDGVNYEEYFFTDYETDIPGLRIDEYTGIDALNEIADKLESLQDWEIDIVSTLMGEGYDIDEAIDAAPDCVVWDDCDSMADVAERYADETGLLESIPQSLRYYFDFDSYGRDMAYEGHFIRTDNGYIEVAR